MWPLFATNSKGKADRGRALGWKPVASKEDFKAYVKNEVKKVVSQSK